MENKNFYDSLPTIATADVVVAGGGIAGCSAAIASAREGASTILIESGGCLGGSITGSLVAPISSVKSKDNKIEFGGILFEIMHEAGKIAQAYCGAENKGANWSGTSLHPYKYAFVKLLTESNATPLFHMFVTDVVSDDKGKIEYIVVSTKAGLRKIKGKVFIDATGDGDIMGKSAADTIVGSEPNVLKSVTEDKSQRLESPKNLKSNDYVGQLQPVSYMMLYGNVDVEKALQYMNKKLTFSQLGITKEEFLKWEYANTLGFETDETDTVPMPQGRVWLCASARKNEAVINMSRIIGVNACDPLSYSDAEVKATLQLVAIMSFLKNFIPGFENSYMIEYSSTLGIRESRRLIGDYVLTGRDTIQCKPFKDTIAHGSYIIDIHDPTGKRMAIGGQVHQNYYSIPYRCLVTRKVPNLATAGRSISSDHVSMSSTRIQGTASLTGQAAGTAAAMAVKEDVSMSDVNVEKLQEKLINAKVFLDIPKE